MKLMLLFLVISAISLQAGEPCGPSSVLRLSDAQLDEFDATYWVTLTKDQQALLNQRAGVSPSRVRVEYDCPSGERSELGYNIALKISTNQIKILHRFLLSDDAAKKKRDEDRLIVAASAPGTTKELPAFAIDSEGKLWRWISRADFASYVARDSKDIALINFQVPSSMPSKNTIASDDTLRQVIKISKANSVPVYVVNAH